MDLICYVQIPGNAPGKRIGIVKINEDGYYHCDYDNPNNSDEDITALVLHLNIRMGVPAEVADAARLGSMFGWHCPAAQPAVEWATKQQEEVKQ